MAKKWTRKEEDIIFLFKKHRTIEQGESNPNFIGVANPLLEFEEEFGEGTETTARAKRALDQLIEWDLIWDKSSLKYSRLSANGFSLINLEKGIESHIKMRAKKEKGKEAEERNKQHLTKLNIFEKWIKIGGYIVSFLGGWFAKEVFELITRLIK